MKFSPLQTSQVTGAARMLQVTAGVTVPTYLWGWQAYMDSGRTEATLVLSNTTTSTVTYATGTQKTNVKVWATIKAGTSITDNLMGPGIWPMPVKCDDGLRGKIVGGHTGVTCIVFFGG